MDSFAWRSILWTELIIFGRRSGKKTIKELHPPLNVFYTYTYLHISGARNLCKTNFLVSYIVVLIH